ncbi:hypothetical protein ACWIGM_05295 [Bosea sp. NPDC055332]
MIWKWLRAASESSGLASTWYAAAAGDADMPQEAEASIERLWSEDCLVQAAHSGVDYCERHGRIVPYAGIFGSLVYSSTGRSIRVGVLVLADDLRNYTANDNHDEAEETEDVQELDGVLNYRGTYGPPGNIGCDSGYNSRVRAGSIIGIRHRDKDGNVVTLTRSRKKDGAYRDRKTAPPLPDKPLAGEDVLDARQRITRLIAILDPQIVAVLDFSIDAPSFASIGEHLGKSGDYAKRAGRNALIKACAELDAALQKEKYKYAA